MGSGQRSFHEQHRGASPGETSTDAWVPFFVLALSFFLASLMILTSALLDRPGNAQLARIATLAAPISPEAESAAATERPAGVTSPPNHGPAAAGATNVPAAVPAHDDPALRRAIEEAIGGDAGHLSVVVRRLTDGRSASIDGDREFYAASTFKLAVLYEAERQASLGLLNLDGEVFFSEDDVNEDLGTIGEVPVEDDGGVVIRNALRAMITVSDNSSAVALLHLLGGGTIDGTLRGLGLTTTSVNTTDLPTTANDMAILMEAIVSGRGVSAKARAEMRALLLDQQSRSGIPGGLPRGVQVGNKTGTWEGATHDIAFVDAPSGAYVIAILSDQGWDWAPLTRVSEAVFREMSGRR